MTSTAAMDGDKDTLPRITAVIGVWTRGNRTYYVHRSGTMRNYPGAWSLFSEQYDPAEIDPDDHAEIKKVFDRMSKRRLGGVQIKVGRLVSARSRYTHALGSSVTLRLFEIELEHEPILNPEFYSEAAWLTNDEFRKRVTAVPCGMCTRMLSDYRMHRGEIDEPLVELAR